jgi:hypothetical protein
MSLSKHRFAFLPEIAASMVAIAVSVAFTLMALYLFPAQIVPGYSTTRIEVPAPPSRTVAQVLIPQ